MDEKQQITKLNETIAEKFARIETNISSADGIQELFEKLLHEMTEEFAIPYIWFSFISSRKTRELIKKIEPSKLLKNRINSVTSSTFEDLIKSGNKPLLANSDLKPFFKLLPRSNKFFLKSLAIAPISLKGVIIGSLNYGDSDSRRYSPDMDTTLLFELAEKFSLRLAALLADCGQESPTSEEQSKM